MRRFIRHWAMMRDIVSFIAQEIAISTCIDYRLRYGIFSSPNISLEKTEEWKIQHIFDNNTYE